jgi:uncharacterized protein
MPEETTVHKAKPGRPLRRAPVRTCVACQQAKTKRELVRVVHTPANSVEVDATGKKAGRGAYLCAKKSCWQLALKKHALERALKTTISPENVAMLEAFADTLKE